MPKYQSQIGGVSDEVTGREILEILGPSPSREDAVDRQNMRFTDLPVKKWLQLYVPFALAFIVGLAGTLYDAQWLGSRTIHALADALIVAGIIGILLELFSTRIVIERVADDLAEKLVGRGLPRELQAHINSIVKTVFVRDHYLQIYRIIDADEDAKVQLDISVSFEVKNYSDSAKDYSPAIGAEMFYSPEFKYLEYGLPNGEAHCLNAADLAKLVKIEETTNVKSVSKEALRAVELKPFDNKSENICRVTWNYSLTMPEEYTDLTDFSNATTDVTLRLDDIPERLEFSASGEDVHHEENSRLWRYSRPYINGQHVQVRWFKKKK